MRFDAVKLQLSAVVKLVKIRQLDCAARLSCRESLSSVLNEKDFGSTLKVGNCYILARYKV